MVKETIDEIKGTFNYDMGNEDQTVGQKSWRFIIQWTKGLICWMAFLFIFIAELAKYGFMKLMEWATMSPK